MVARTMPPLNGGVARPPLVPGLRLTRKYRQILSFLYDLGHGANLPMFYHLFGIRHPTSKNEYGKLAGTLERLGERGLVDCLHAPWHNGKVWVLTDLGAAWGRYFSGEFRATRAFLQRRDEVIQNDPFRPPARAPAPPGMAPAAAGRDGNPPKAPRT